MNFTGASPMPTRSADMLEKTEVCMNVFNMFLMKVKIYGGKDTEKFCKNKGGMGKVINNLGGGL